VDKSKVKNFILLLLALVNAFLLYLVISNVQEARRAQELRVEALRAVFAERGIALGEAVEFPEAVPPLLTLLRDTSAEEKSLRRLIGGSIPQDQGGNVFFYDGADGQAKTRGTGEVDILVYAGPRGKDPLSAAKSAMRKLGLDYSEHDATVTEDGQVTRVILGCAYDGTPIQNARIRFDFSGGSLQIISGSKPLDERYAVQSAEDYPDGVTVLMSFLEYIARSGKVCSEIRDLRIVYYMYSAVSGSCTLRPIWRIGTDAGTYYFDAETLRVEQLESSP
jgi:hypothetical protein